MIVTVAKWTLSEYHHMIETGLLEDKQVELIRGDIVEMAPEGEPHAYASSESGEYLAELLGKRAKVRYGNPITLPNRSEPQPDIAIVQRLGREYRQHHPYPENIFWLIEYSNASLAKDLKLKSQTYAEANIPEYWVVNLQNQSLVVFRAPQAGEYTSQATYTEGQLTPVAFPHVSVSVAAIIGEV